MKFFSNTLVIFCTLWGALSSPVYAVDLPPTPTQINLGILDIDRVIQEAKVTKQIQDVIEKERDELQKDVEEFEKKLRIKETTLKEMQNKNDPRFEDEKKLFEDAVTEVHKRISGRSRILEKAFHDARAKVFQKVMTLLGQHAQSQKITLVIPKNVVMYQADSYEITDEILNKLNREMPSLDIPIAKGGA